MLPQLKQSNSLFDSRSPAAGFVSPDDFLLIAGDFDPVNFLFLRLNKFLL